MDTISPSRLFQCKIILIAVDLTAIQLKDIISFGVPLAHNFNEWSVFIECNKKINKFHNERPYGTSPLITIFTRDTYSRYRYTFKIESEYVKNMLCKTINFERKRMKGIKKEDLLRSLKNRRNHFVNKEDISDEDKSKIRNIYASAEAYAYMEHK